MKARPSGISSVMVILIVVPAESDNSKIGAFPRTFGYVMKLSGNIFPIEAPTDHAAHSSNALHM